VDRTNWEDEVYCTWLNLAQSLAGRRNPKRNSFLRLLTEVLALEGVGVHDSL
jgi:hypothetical protein